MSNVKKASINKRISRFISNIRGMKRENETMTVEEKRALIINEKTPFQIREAYKTLRSNILFSLPDDNNNKIIITSALASEGKSTTCINTAISFAETDKKVLIIDCDLRRPNIANLLNIQNKPGLSNVLVRMNSVEEAIKCNVRKNLDILPAGDIPPNPSELLDSERMKKLLETLGEKYDYIFLDTSPVLVVTDTAVLTRYCSGVLLLARYNRTDRNAVAAAVEQLMLANAKILGGIFNGIDNEGESYKYSRYGKYGKYGGYGYGYGYYRTSENADDERK